MIDRSNRALFGTRAVAHTCAIIPDADAINEAERRAEVFLDVLRFNIRLEFVTRYFHIDSVSPVITDKPVRAALLRPELARQNFTERAFTVTVKKVDAYHRVVFIAGRIAVRDNESDCGLFEDVVGSTRDEQVLCRDIAVRFLANCQCPDIEVANAPGKLGTALDAHFFAVLGQTDASREEWPTVGIDIAKLEDAGILQKEIAFLREEQRESVQRNLLFIYLGCREVGIERERCAQRRRNAVPCIQRWFEVVLNLSDTEITGPTEIH